MDNGNEGLCKVVINHVNPFAEVHEPCDPFFSNKAVRKTEAVWKESVLFPDDAAVGWK